MTLKMSSSKAWFYFFRLSGDLPDRGQFWPRKQHGFPGEERVKDIIDADFASVWQELKMVLLVSGVHEGLGRLDVENKLLETTRSIVKRIADLKEGYHL